MKTAYNQQPAAIIPGETRTIECFATDTIKGNINLSVIDSFGEEWKKFYQFSDKELLEIGAEYFDIITDKMVNKSSYCIDVGCGTGRWSKYLHKKVGFIECVDPSDAVLVADKVLKGVDNVRLCKASTDNLPFPDKTFDFGMSVGVLHHIPNTYKALADCVSKIKIDGYFYIYLYYALDNKGALYKVLFLFVNIARKLISSMPSFLKKIVCDIIAVIIYMPIILTGRFLRFAGFKSFSAKMPLSGYHERSFFIVRNDTLDRFGTKLEQRFTRMEIVELMEKAGLGEILVSENFPYWHAVGKRIK